MFDINTASMLPSFPFILNDLKQNPYLPILIDDKTAIEFSERLVNLTKEGYFTKPLNYSVIKNFQKNYTLDIASPNVFLLLEYNRYSEYAINQLSHAINTNQRKSYYE